MTRVVATGVFEIIHPGHIFFLNEAKKLGDELVVIVARDTTAKKRKRHPVINENQRLKVVQSLKPVDKAILGDITDFFKPILRINPDILVLGPNQNFNPKHLELEFKNRNLKIKIVRLKKMLKGKSKSSKKIIERIKKSR